MPGSTVAVFTGEFDVTADYVIAELNRRKVPVVRCDPGEFPSSLAIGARLDAQHWAGHISTATRRLDLEDVACAWWRRPSPIETPAEQPASKWVQGENRAGVNGLLACLPWLNHPDVIRRAEHKPVQLTTAAITGLTVPPTLLTNDPNEVRAFAKEHETLIYKPLNTGLLDECRIIYASRVDLDRLDGVTLAMNMFQVEVPKDHELRVTIVDGQVFAARIDALTDAGRQDWRADYKNLSYTVAELPAKVITQLRYFMARMNLRFAAIDMIVTPDGRHVFLEANPNGQWAWIEDETGLPIAAAIADALEGRRS